MVAQTASWIPRSFRRLAKAAVTSDNQAVILLSELLERRELGLRLAAGPPHGGDVRIMGLEVCELPDPRPWLESGSMLMTAGVGLGHGARRQRLLVERCVQADAAAIAFAVGLAHADAPGPIAERCEEAGLPLVIVPPGTPARVLSAAVGERAAAHQLQAAQRGLSIQSHLMEALAAPEPEAELLRRLGSLLSATALIVDEQGGIEGAPSGALPDELWGPLRGGHGVGLHHLRGRRYVTAQVADRVGARRWIVVAGKSAALPDQLARQALQSAGRLARLVERARPPRPAEARAVRSELADELLGFRPVGERRVLARRAAALGLGVDAPLEVALVRVHGEGDGVARSQRAARAQGELEAHLTAASVPFLSTHRDGDVVLVAPGPLARPLEAALAPAGGFDAGIGRPATTLDGLPRSLLDARFALQQLRAAGPPEAGAPRLLAHADLDLATALACDADPAVAGPRRAALLNRVSTPELRETLLCHLDHDLDVQRTAEALHLHANSLRYRLGRIEAQLGRSLRDPATIASLYIAGVLERAGEGS